MRSVPDGTHSILDMTGVGDERGFQTVGPMPQERLVQLFGTARPTPDAVDSRKTVLWDELQRWQGCYVVAYEDDHPASIVFIGVSGD